MLKKIFYTLLSIIILLAILSFWVSPNMFGLIPGGKDSVEKGISDIKFDTTSSNNFKFIYDKDENITYLSRLREKYKLDSVVKNADNDLEKVLFINEWVHGRWKHDGSNRADKEDALYILKEAAKGKKFRCVEYGIVAKTCLSAIGIKSRVLRLRTKDVEEVKYGAGHVVAEAYLDDIQKWMFLDPQWDVVVTKNGLPLNAVELQRAIYEKDSIEIISDDSTLTKQDYIDWISPYLFYFKIKFDNTINGSVSIWDRIWGNKKFLTLVPIGKKEPHIFQRVFRMRSSLYTHSLKDFYSNPNVI